MKPLLLLLLSCFCFLITKAQTEQGLLPKFGPQRPLIYGVPKAQNKVPLHDSLLNLQNFSLRNRPPGVYSLPLDNMPCIVPDSSKTVSIPNAWKGSRRIPYQGNPPHIPNLTPKWIPTPIADADSKTK